MGGNSLSIPVTSIAVERHGSNICKSACSNMNGYRNSNEDAHAIMEHNNRCFSGIFDGHGGVSCSKFVSENLPLQILQEQNITSETIKSACSTIDDNYMKLFSDRSGTTASFSIVEKNDDKYKVIIGNIGDSFALLVRQNNSNFVTIEHKPLEASELERIEKNDGCVYNGRVNGTLAVSRSFGDIELKKFVISEPDVTEFVCEKGDIIIHICDGISESDFSIDEIRKYLIDEINEINKMENCGDLAIATTKICFEALSRNSTDNLSCMVIILEDGTEYIEQYKKCEFVPCSFLSTNSNFCDAYFKMANVCKINKYDLLSRRLHIINDEISLTEFEKFVYDISIMKMDDSKKEIEKNKINEYIHASQDFMSSNDNLDSM